MSNKEVKHMKMLELGDKAILSVDHDHHFLINLNEFNNSKVKFYVDKNDLAIPSNYSIWFNSYKEETDVIKFTLEVDNGDEFHFPLFKINGFMDKKGNVSNCFFVESVNNSYEIYIPMECCDNTNLIVWWCMNSIKSYYLPLSFSVESKGYSKKLSHYEQ